MILAVLDTNVFVSGVLRANGIPGQLLGYALEGQRFTLVTSPHIMAEIGDVLMRPRIMDRLGWTERQVDYFMERLYSVSLVIEGRLVIDVVVSDPSDNKFLAAAIESGAEYVVSGDSDLLDLERHEGVQIMSPRDFFELLHHSQ